jgi:lipoate-protein ligase B
MADTGPGPIRALWLGTVPYRQAWNLQRALAAARRRGEIDDCVLLLEHPPVYTMGRNGEAEHIPGGPEKLLELGAEYIEIDRGGSVTFHGPGQLVAYPILDLRARFPLEKSERPQADVIRYVRALERALIATAAARGLNAGVNPPFTGIWVEQSKLAAIGVKVAGGVSSHGIALNVSTRLEWFNHIVPCGIYGAGVASFESLGQPTTVREAGDEFARQLAAVCGAPLQYADERLQAAADIGMAVLVP